jgi:hypothetical protein
MPPKSMSWYAPFHNFFKFTKGKYSSVEIDEISQQTLRKAWPAIGIIESIHGCILFIIANGCN